MCLESNNEDSNQEAEDSNQEVEDSSQEADNDEEESSPRNNYDVTSSQKVIKILLFFIITTDKNLI